MFRGKNPRGWPEKRWLKNTELDINCFGLSVTRMLYFVLVSSLLTLKRFQEYIYTIHT